MITTQGIDTNNDWDYTEHTCEKTHIRLRRSKRRQFPYISDCRLFETDTDDIGYKIPEQVFEIIKKLIW
jgi:hypothetical protein